MDKKDIEKMAKDSFIEIVIEQFSKVFKVRNNDEETTLHQILDEIKETNDILRDTYHLITEIKEEWQE